MLATYTPASTGVSLPAVVPLTGASGPRVLVLLDPDTARPQVLTHIEATGVTPSLIVLLWVVTPGELLTWGALAAEPVADRTGAMLAALGERMARARRRLAPLQWACRQRRDPGAGADRPRDGHGIAGQSRPRCPDRPGDRPRP